MLEDHGWLWWILIGLVAGGIAKLLMPGKDPGGFIVTILLGIGGAMLAGTIGRVVGWYDEPTDGAGFIAAILGALLILFVYRLVLRRS
jgi:uncharacterized membrane protein YeaQ/YmgE (transglycosylase-associated protein family)